MSRQYLTLPAFSLVEVTEDDIRDGRPADAFRCPVALAVARALGVTDERDISVWDGFATVWNGALSEDYDLGADAQSWIEAFDLGYPVKPVAFRATRVDRRQREQETDAAEVA